ncbi:MAG: transcription antitermination factor NusB [Micrococcales bacterium]
MSARTKARKRAVDAIFAADLRKVSPDELLNQTAQLAKDRQNQDEIFSYAGQIVGGIIEHHADIDDLIETYSNDWSIDRMPALDRAIVRVAIWEIVFNDEVPGAVAIDEAVELAKEYSTDDSAGFINGLLHRISATRSAQ